MKKNDTLIDSVNEIGLKTYEKLKALSVPPYPKYYHDTFMDFLYASDNPEMIDLSKKYSYLFNIGEDNSVMMDNSLSIAKESLQEFQQSSQNLRLISEDNIVDLTEFKKEPSRVHTGELVNLFGNFQRQVIDELQTADETIVRLKLEIEKLERESNIDPLTKVHNRRALIKDLHEVLNFGMDHDLDVHLLFLDADDFKNINDSFGHIAGDKTLIYLAKLLQSSLRRGTRVYRYGGEEFIIILNRTERDEAIKTVDRILKETSESKLFYKGNNIHLTLSAGITSHKKGDTPESFIDRADKGLLAAKEAGKNCFKEEQ